MPSIMDKSTFEVVKTSLIILMSFLSIQQAPSFCFKWDIKVNHIIFFWNKAHFSDIEYDTRT